MEPPVLTADSALFIHRIIVSPHAACPAVTRTQQAKMSSVVHRQFEEQIDGFILQLIRSCWSCNKPPRSSPDDPPNWITACAHCVCTDCLYPNGGALY